MVDPVDMRPESLERFVGQKHLKARLQIRVDAAKKRGINPPHMLFLGGPGLGKTSVSRLIAKEFGKNLIETTGSAITNTECLVKLIKRINEGDFIFIDELHLLPRQLQEYMLVVLEDFKLDCEVKKEVVRMDLPRFTMIAATTRNGDIDHAFRERFGIQEVFQLYLATELCEILQAYAVKKNFDARDERALVEIAQRSRGTPRIALRFMDGIMDYATVHDVDSITWPLIWEYFHDIQKVDPCGLTSVDLTLLRVLVEEGPLSLSSWAAVIGEQPKNIEETLEPFYIREGYIRRTSKGREALEKAIRLFPDLCASSENVIPMRKIA